MMGKKKITRIIDFGEKAFKDVKIETICFILDTQKNRKIQLLNPILQTVLRVTHKYISLMINFHIGLFTAIRPLMM